VLLISVVEDIDDSRSHHNIPKTGRTGGDLSFIDVMA
jgi:hypothetical protein